MPVLLTGRFWSPGMKYPSSTFQGGKEPGPYSAEDSAYFKGVFKIHLEILQVTSNGDKPCICMGIGVNLA